MTEEPDKDGEKPPEKKSNALVLILVNLIVIVLGITFIIDGLSP